MKRFNLCAILLALVLAILSAYGSAEAKFTMAYVSDSPSSSVPFWGGQGGGPV